MTPSIQNIFAQKKLRHGLRAIAAFDGKSEDEVLHEIISGGIHSRMETMSHEWAETSSSSKSETHLPYLAG